MAPGELGPPPFSPTTEGIFINTLFFVSLTCSLISAFGALLGQQWIVNYKRLPKTGFEGERRERQRRLIGAKRWYLEPILVTFLPMLLQASLLIFIAGMIAYIKSLSHTVARWNTVISSIAAALLIISTAFALVDPYCPFKTPLSDISAWFMRMVHEGLNHRFPYFMPNQSFPKWGKSFRRKWLITSWEEGAIEALSLRRILATSSDVNTMHDMALNIPLLPNSTLVDVISSDNHIITGLFDLYRSNTDSDAVVFSAAICHLAFVAGHGHHERIHLLLRSRELDIIHSAAQGHISRPKDPQSLLPSSILTVGLSFWLWKEDVIRTHDHDETPYDNPYDNLHIKFLLDSLKTTSVPDFSLAVIAWILVGRPGETGIRAASTHQNRGSHIGRDAPFSAASEIYSELYVL